MFEVPVFSSSIVNENHEDESYPVRQTKGGQCENKPSSTDTLSDKARHIIMWLNRAVYDKGRKFKIGLSGAHYEGP